MLQTKRTLAAQSRQSQGKAGNAAPKRGRLSNKRKVAGLGAEGYVVERRVQQATFESVRSLDPKQPLHARAKSRKTKAPAPEAPGPGPSNESAVKVAVPAALSIVPGRKTVAPALGGMDLPKC